MGNADGIGRGASRAAGREKWGRRQKGRWSGRGRTTVRCARENKREGRCRGRCRGRWRVRGRRRRRRRRRRRETILSFLMPLLFCCYTYLFSINMSSPFASSNLVAFTLIMVADLVMVAVKTAPPFCCWSLVISYN